MRKLMTASAFIVLGLLACNKEPAKPVAPPAAAPAAAAPVPTAVAPAAAPAKAGGAGVVLTEDKITRFLTYQKEISAVTAEAVAVGVGAYQKAGTDQKKFEKAMGQDDRIAKIAAASKAALEKSGLTQEDVTKLTQMLTPYYARVYAMQMMLGGMAGGKAKAEGKKAGDGKSPTGLEAALDKMHEGQSAQLEKTRKDFAEQYGQPALEVAQKHEPEFMVLNEKMMNAAMGGMRKAP
jgi:hypothetical protein